MPTSKPPPRRSPPPKSRPAPAFRRIHVGRLGVAGPDVHAVVARSGRVRLVTAGPSVIRQTR